MSVDENKLNFKKTLDEALKSATKTKSIASDPEFYIYEYFDEIKNKVDLRREKIKVEIDEYSDQLIQSIDSARDNCVRLQTQVIRLTTDIEKSNNELNELMERFNTSTNDENELEDVKNKAEDLKNKFNGLLAEYRSSLLENKEYSFVFDAKPIEDIFGKIIDYKIFDSKILLEPNLQNELSKLCEFSVVQKWMLQYRASSDGFDSEDFHRKCDGIANTLTVIKTTNGNIFGGFTEEAWSSTDGSVYDSNAFIFSLINKDGKPFKVMCSNNEYAISCNSLYGSAIYCHSVFGPSFGGDDNFGDICIASNSNSNLRSYSDFGFSYEHPEYEFETDSAKSILAGAYNFQTVEIEVHTKIN